MKASQYECKHTHAHFNLLHALSIYGLKNWFERHSVAWIYSNQFANTICTIQVDWVRDPKRRLLMILPLSFMRAQLNCSDELRPKVIWYDSVKFAREQRWFLWQLPDLWLAFFSLSVPLLTRQIQRKKFHEWFIDRWTWQLFLYLLVVFAYVLHFLWSLNSNEWFSVSFFLFAEFFMDKRWTELFKPFFESSAGNFYYFVFFRCRSFAF